MSVLQIIAISLFVYLGSIGSIVGNTIGWYTLGRPLVASFVVGVIMGDLQTAMIVGIALQIMYMGNVTPGGAVAWDLSYATYIGTAGALVFGKGMESTHKVKFNPFTAVQNIGKSESHACADKTVQRMKNCVEKRYFFIE